MSAPISKNLISMSPADRQRPAINPFLGKTFRLEIHLPMNLLINSRNPDEDGGTNLQQSLWKLIEKRNISQRDAAGKHGEIDMPRGNVGQRKKRNTDLTAANRKPRKRMGDVRCHVAVCEHRPLRCAR